jgi:1,2-diacylglycerol 3-alpha-glucosyltransferase
LVVNEAMASGVPVIVSRVAGCVADLVDEAWNGILFAPGDVIALSGAMKSLAGNPEIRASMAANSVTRIAQYSPQTWTDGLVRAVERVGAKRE